MGEHRLGERSQITSSSSHVQSVFGTRQRVNARALEATSYGPPECAHRQAVPAQLGAPSAWRRIQQILSSWQEHPEQRSSLRGKHATAASEPASNAGFRWAGESLSELAERLLGPFHCSLQPSRKHFHHRFYWHRRASVQRSGRCILHTVGTQVQRGQSLEYSARAFRGGRSATTPEAPKEG